MTGLCKEGACAVFPPCPGFGAAPTVFAGIAFAPAAEVAYAPPFSAPTNTK